RLRVVPPVRYPEAAADTLLRPHVQERIRRDARRPGGRFLHVDRDRGCCEDIEVTTKKKGTKPGRQGTKHREPTLYRLAEKVGAALKKRSVMLATAESCTGGWIAEAVTMVPGSSEWFERGFVTYTYISKREMLGVKDATLGRHGAVAEEVVREMAEGALARSH